MFVDPAWRGRGIGRALLEYAISACGATMLDINEQNEQTLSFCQKMGFCVVGRSARDPRGKLYSILHMHLG